ncbi:hypothetical protein F7725_019074 [Dissostichus mawsoni]|uniref:Uncharacterized protein n=1 Tax=Dissostichus mawsoni TaxID=36200 RepID=A0A7J5XV06_DISMA|nr:hypothetical protein F7725_019074 [Dissostichus mawsoni]
MADCSPAEGLTRDSHTVERSAQHIRQTPTLWNDLPLHIRQAPTLWNDLPLHIRQTPTLWNDLPLHIRQTPTLSGITQLGYGP